MVIRIPYKCDPPQTSIDHMILGMSGSELAYDPVATDFLLQSYSEVQAARQRADHALVDILSLGQGVPWLYRLKYEVRGLARTAGGEVVTVDQHTIALRLLPDCLRSINRFAALSYVEPRVPTPFHPNVSPDTGAICLEIYPGEPVLQIIESLHDLIRWRIRNLNEAEALNIDACVYGRNHVPAALDNRPLWGRRWKVALQPQETTP
jgi:hypothetical protein